MECASCRSLNDPGRRYCRRCGLRLGTSCLQCNFFNAADDDYCGGCGWDLLIREGSAVGPGSARSQGPPLAAKEPPLSALDLKEDEIETLFTQGPAPETTHEKPPSISQNDIDSFFEKLSEKGDAEYPSHNTSGKNPPNK